MKTKILTLILLLCAFALNAQDLTYNSLKQAIQNGEDYKAIIDVDDVHSNSAYSSTYENINPCKSRDILINSNNLFAKSIVNTSCPTEGKVYMYKHPSQNAFNPNNIRVAVPSNTTPVALQNVEIRYGLNWVLISGVYEYSNGAKSISIRIFKQPDLM